jgi:type 1 glutamine amidotransferase
METKFDKASAIERMYLSNIPGIVSFTPSENSEFHDGICIISGKTNQYQTIIAEAKVRTFGVNKYPTAIIEKSKYDALIPLVRQFNFAYPVYYFAYYPVDRQCYIFDMYNTKHKVTFGMMLPSTTMGYKGLVPTDVIEYDLNDAIGKYKLKEIFN